MTKKKAYVGFNFGACTHKPVQRTSDLEREGNDDTNKTATSWLAPHYTRGYFHTDPASIGPPVTREMTESVAAEKMRNAPISCDSYEFDTAKKWFKCTDLKAHSKPSVAADGGIEALLISVQTTLVNSNEAILLAETSDG